MLRSWAGFKWSGSRSWIGLGGPRSRVRGETNSPVRRLGRIGLLFLWFWPTSRKIWAPVYGFSQMSFWFYRMSTFSLIKPYIFMAFWISLLLDFSAFELFRLFSTCLLARIHKSPCEKSWITFFNDMMTCTVGKFCVDEKFFGIAIQLILASAHNPSFSWIFLQFSFLLTFSALNEAFSAAIWLER